MAESVNANGEYADHVAKRLTAEEIEKMHTQNSRLVSEFRANQLEKDAKKHWDLFYKRNDTRFFKDRHWTTREFSELLGVGSLEDPKVLLEVGCGVGNFVYPLVEDGLKFKRIFACDLSPRAVDLMKAHASYDPETMKIFQADVTAEDCFADVNFPVNAVTLIFVLSAIHPEKFRRSYYFTTEEVAELFESVGFNTLTCDYVKRRTINVKENIDVERIFVQGKFEKP
ncbi:tRNA N(3)-cytidine methyltransferase METTL6 isoform X2 [Lasioglossum baleicum]|uniref:tRNA N(3)-cytidine methyltransferase METTL6 isoform X2 n=1 Tax=Lasioglossum baleicum TaxID=434251 RepID=UPI003FCD2E17